VSVRLDLLGPPGPVPVGRPADVRAVVHNDGPDAVWMVGVLDGSETGTRYPVWRPSVERDGIVVAAPPAPEDPMVGPLRPSDFVCLAAGATLDAGRLATFATFAPAEAGEYEYRVELSTESPRDEDWLGRFNQDPAVVESVARVPRLVVAAAVVVRFA
jgi:hypothetical protein